MFWSAFAVGSGAVFGALLRWGLGNRLNSLLPLVPPGTLAANWLGGYLAGVAVAVLATMPQLSPNWRLFIITGFLGALTTFSSFSLEMTTLIQQGKLTWAFGGIAAHVIGTLVMTFIGIGSVQLVRQLLSA